MAMSREDVIWVYRIFLGREPESEATIDAQINSGSTRTQMIIEVMRSDEFLSKHVVR